MSWIGSKFYALVKLSTDQSLLSMGLPLNKACWVPRGRLPVWPGDDHPKTPTSPTSPMRQPEGSTSPAWDLRLKMPEVEVEVPSDPMPAAPGQSC
jgi:hypothetical protein